MRSAPMLTSRETELPQAIGGGLALGYYAEPGLTIDIESMSSSRSKSYGGRALRGGPEYRPALFSHDILHASMPDKLRLVPFAGASIPIVAPEHLLVRKAMLDRQRDRLDMEAVPVASRNSAP